jgi:hypothetical protein
MKSHVAYNLIGLIVMSSLFATARAWSQSPWQFNYRLQALMETDTNVREDLHKPAAAQSTRFMIQPKVSNRKGLLKFQLGYQGGLQLYQRYASENKLINEVNGKLFYDITPWFKAGLQGFARLKRFHNKESDYTLDQLNPFIQVVLPAGFVLQTTYGDESMSYANTRFFDYESSLLYVSVTKKITPGLSISPMVSSGSIDLNRRAYKVVPGLLNWQQKNVLQQDRVVSYKVQMDWLYKGLLLNASYGYDAIASNSYGFSYRRHAVTLLFAKSLFGVLVRGYGTIQKKTYLDKMLPIWPLQLDTEKEESNFLVMDFSYDLTAATAVMIRCAYYNNESPWADLYYEKWLVNAGFEFKFYHD